MRWFREITRGKAPRINKNTDLGRGRKRDTTAHLARAVQAIREVQHTIQAARYLGTSFRPAVGTL